MRSHCRRRRAPSEAAAVGIAPHPHVTRQREARSGGGINGRHDAQRHGPARRRTAAVDDCIAVGPNLCVTARVCRAHDDCVRHARGIELRFAQPRVSASATIEVGRSQWQPRPQRNVKSEVSRRVVYGRLRLAALTVERYGQVGHLFDVVIEERRAASRRKCGGQTDEKSR